MTGPFSDKLRLVLKRASMSAAQLAKETRVHKSVVSRWLAGSVTPSAHNLARLTAVLAQTLPDLRLLDWDRDLADLAGRIGAGDAPEAAPSAVRKARGLPLTLLDEALVSASRQARAYEGFYRITRVTAMSPTGFVHEFAIVRMEPIGLLSMRIVSFGAKAEGWLLPLHGQIHMILADPIHGGLVFGAANAEDTRRVTTMGSILMGSSPDVARTPTGQGAHIEHVADLTGDEAADEARFLALTQSYPIPQPDEITDGMRAVLLRDFGPRAAAAGGDMLLRMPPVIVGDAWAAPDRPAPRAPREDAATGFAARLRLVTGLTSISGGQLAAAVGVHKSVVSRWLSGATEPSAANLARLTAVIAGRAPGFTLLDWGRAPDELARRLGADDAALPPARGEGAPAGLPLTNWEGLVADAASRGGAYHGFYRLTRHDPFQYAPGASAAASPVSSPVSGALICEHMAVTPDPSGLPRLRIVTAGGVLDGWLLPVQDQVYAIAADRAAGHLLCGAFNGVTGPKVEAIDGLILLPGVEGAPTAMPALCERTGDLSGDADADEARFAALAATPAVPEGGVRPAVRARLLRDGGPLAAAGGGERLLRMPLDGSLARARGVENQG
jgi:transcriptional regulator with XRE-family HTH domain